MALLNSVSVCMYVLFVLVFSLCSGQRFGVLCGPHRCAQNASCVSGECTCDGGTAGSGTVLCARDGIECGCIGFGLPDPHTKTFDGLSIHATLACTYLVASLSTQTGCYVEVKTMTRVRKQPMFPFRVLNDLIKVKVIRDNSEVMFTLGWWGVSGIAVRVIPRLPDRIPNPDVVITTDQFNGFFRAVVQNCDTAVAYDPALATLTVTTATSSTWTNTGFCGNCNSQPRDDNRFVGVHNTTQPEADLAFSLRALTTDQTTPVAALCRVIERQVHVTSCTNDAVLVRAVRCCSIYYDSSYANCVMVNKPTSSVYMLSLFVNCLTSYCSGQVAVAAVQHLALLRHDCVVPTDYTCV